MKTAVVAFSSLFVRRGMMNEQDNKILLEIRSMLKIMMEEQKQMLENILELKSEQKKIQEEVKLNNFVLNNINLRNEILN